MKIKRIILVTHTDHEIGAKLVINDKVIAECNYEEHGSSGFYLLDNMLHNIAQLAKIYPEEIEISTNFEWNEYK